MTYVEKILKEAKTNGKKVDAGVVKALRAVEKMHELMRRCKGSPSKLLEKFHRTGKW